MSGIRHTIGLICSPLASAHVARARFRRKRMQSIRLHIAGDGVVWAMSRCKICGEVSKHLVSDAIGQTIPCGKCGHAMDMRGATIEAVAKADAADRDSVGGAGSAARSR
jgi:hypothetical protein